jgi:Mor family transcriptional regulator
MMTRQENSEAVAQLFDRLHSEFGRMAPQIIQVMVDTIGGCRLTFPDLRTLYNTERNRRIRNEFTGANHQELAIKYRISMRSVRRVLMFS